jgi:hypothetical protein
LPAHNGKIWSNQNETIPRRRVRLIDEIARIWQSNPTAIVGIVAIAVAVYGTALNRKTSRQKNAIDLMQKMREDEELKESLRFLRAVFESSCDTLEIIAKSPKAYASDRKKVIYALNFFESMGVGVRHGIYDRDIISDNIGSTIAHTWKVTGGFINLLRGDTRPKSYEHFEWLAKCTSDKRWFKVAGCRIPRFISNIF